MLLDAIATAILAGLMLVPLVNVVVGGVLGAGLAGPLGGVVGILLAVAITSLETWLADRFGLRDLRVEPSVEEALAATETHAMAERTIRTAPPSRRRQSQTGRTLTAARHAAAAKRLQHSAAH